MAAFEDEETSCGLCHSRDCLRPENLRGRAIHFPLCDGGRLCEVRNETSRAGSAQGRAASFYPDQLASCGAALSVEDQYRDHCFLGWRTSRRQQPGSILHKFMGLSLVGELWWNRFP